ncbi:hypothetical protein PVW51_09235 [Sulfitobacter sp. PR48]|nr:hypothetical protein [Sulfitobacter sp. PR48]MDD9720876.1 hypothetical protein [Sulfitobacter sp. PR48]
MSGPSLLLSACRLDQLDEITATVIEDGHTHGPGVQKVPGERDAVGRQFPELCNQIVDLERRGRDAVGDKGFL